MRVLIQLLIVAVLSLQSDTLSYAAAPNSEGEQVIGRLFDQAVHHQFVVLESRRVDRVLSEIGQKLIEAKGRPDLRLTFRVINEPTANAFSGPGGHVYVTTGLLDILNSRDELAAVLAPEIAHIIAQDASSTFR